MLLPTLLLLSAAAEAPAADANGYTARYELRIGTPPACEQTIAPSDPWSAINWSRRVICLAPGDHRPKGSLILGSSGSTSQKKWLRLAGSDATHPVRLDVGARAILSRLEAYDKSDWVIDRLTILPSGGNNGVLFRNCDRCIVNRALIDGQNGNRGRGGLVRFREQTGTGVSESSSLQNSVIRNTGKLTNADVPCVNFGGRDNRIVNNEIYNCGGDGIVFDLSSYPRQNKVENNDIYQTADYLIGCDGRPGTSCNCGEDAIDIKNNDTNDPADRLEVIQNRMWNWKTTYETCSGTGSHGYAVNDGDVQPKRYVLVKDNVIFQVANGVHAGGNASNWSIVGNLFYDVTHAGSPQDAPNNGDRTNAVAIRLASGDRHEIYLNSVIDSKYGLLVQSGGEYNDLRCNVFLNVQHTTLGGNPSWGSQSVATNNAFFNAAPYGTGGGGGDMSFSQAHLAQTQSYCFKRRLLTGPEPFCIPHARPTANSPHYRSCTGTLGSYSGVGVGGDY